MKQLLGFLPLAFMLPDMIHHGQTLADGTKPGQSFQL